MNDAEGSIFIEDPSGNTYLMDGQGNIKVNAPNDMDFTAGKKVNISAGTDINIQAGLSMYTSVGQNSTTNVGMQYSLFAGDIFESADGVKNSQANTIEEVGGNIEKSSTEGNINANSKGQIKTNSGEKSNLF